MATTIPIMPPTRHKDLSRRAILGGLALSISPMAHMPLRIATDTVAISPLCHPVLALPFVRDSSEEDRASGANPRSFWAVNPGGNYGTDCAMGSHYADLALDYMVAARSPQILQWAIFDMMALNRRHSGIEVGFVSAFGRLATEAHAARWALREGGMV